MPKKRVRYCACGHPKTWHENGDGHCKHGCGCDAFHGRSWGDRPGLLPRSPHSAPTLEKRLEALCLHVEKAFADFRLGLHKQVRYLGELVVPEESPVVVPRARVERVPKVEKIEGQLEPVSKCERAIIAILARRRAPIDIRKLAVWTGYRNSGGFRNAVSALRTRGLIEGGSNTMIRITTVGVTFAPTSDPMPTGQALISFWKLSLCEQSIIEALIHRYPRGLTGAELAEATKYALSGGFRNALSRLRTLELIEGYDEIRATPALAGERAA